MPRMQAQEFVALRFLPQSDYETTAPLSISPSPEVVIRVFMLFKGITRDAVVEWNSTTPSFYQGPEIWAAIVCPGTYLPRNSKTFSVVELGGLEVP
jgi:hypothetical protein